MGRKKRNTRVAGPTPLGRRNIKDTSASGKMTHKQGSIGVGVTFMPIYDTFCLFPRLPMEIQLMIWESAVEDLPARIVTEGMIYSNAKTEGKRCNTTRKELPDQLPSLVPVSQPSRKSRRKESSRPELKAVIRAW